MVSCSSSPSLQPILNGVIRTNFLQCETDTADDPSRGLIATLTNEKTLGRSHKVLCERGIFLSVTVGFQVAKVHAVPIIPFNLTPLCPCPFSIFCLKIHLLLFTWHLPFYSLFKIPPSSHSSQKPSNVLFIQVPMTPPMNPLHGIHYTIP